MAKWTVTYHTITQESAEDGDFADHGFVTSGNWHTSTDTVMEELAACTTEEEKTKVWESYRIDSLKEALNYVNPAEDSGRWFSEVDPDIDYRTGEDEYRSLHPPTNITKASYNRVKRVLGVR